MTKKVNFQRKNSKGFVEQKTEIRSDISRVTLIQMLIPLGLKAIEDALQEEITNLVGNRYSRESNTLQRWGSNPGSAYLGDQKVSVKVPRVRDSKANKEVPLKTYEDLQSPLVINDLVLRRVINGLSMRKYEEATLSIPETFGIKKSTVSKKFITASSKKLKELLGRDLSGEDFIAIFVDGKTFSDMDMIVALGITMEGIKKPLGFIESGSENSKVCGDFINQLIDRGLNIGNEILFIIDGARGLYKGIKSILKDKAIIQRCQWHKRENIVSYLPKSEHVRFRKKLQSAYEKPSYKEAKEQLLKIGKELKLMNESAMNSLLEGLEETLTLHRLDVFPELGRSFKTTNCIENVNRQIGIYTGRVSYWKNSNQRQRWMASSLLETEPRLNKVQGCKHLGKLRDRMQRLNVKNEIKVA